ncbi:hypothetical protein [Nocardioides rubriscoriae]|uniref:hypothetical protein n=1 Tax=Nocardioides rubriscoriae TaxID=642762 RepID=UPI0011DFAFA8|nr:hypothetical protein [Nocardioides rubriscoriae]
MGHYVVLRTTAVGTGRVRLTLAGHSMPAAVRPGQRVLLRVWVPRFRRATAVARRTAVVSSQPRYFTGWVAEGRTTL